MTAYVYTPYCPVPTPHSTYNGSQYTNGNINALIWGAGIRAGTYPIRIAKIESFIQGSLPLYRVDSATFHNSTVIAPATPVDLRQGAPVPTCTTGMSTAVTFYTYGNPYGTYNITVSGTIPSGTFHYLGTCPLATAVTVQSGSTTTTVGYNPGIYQFAFDLTIQPGSMFWFGSNITATQIVVNGGTNNYLAYNGTLAGQSTWAQAATQETVTPVNIYFEEVQEDWTR